MRKMSVILSVLVMVGAAQAQHCIGLVGVLHFADVRLVKVGEDRFEGLDFSHRTLFGFGGVLDLTLAKNISLRIEPMYLQKGGNLEDDPEDFQSFRIKEEYFEVPLLLKAALSSRAIHPYLIAGPTVGLLLSSKGDFDLPSGFGGGHIEVDTQDLNKSVNLGLSFGGGVNIPLGQNAIFIEARYVLGLSNLVEPGKVSVQTPEGFPGELGDLEISEEENWKYRGVQILVGMTFPFGEQ